MSKKTKKKKKSKKIFKLFSLVLIIISIIFIGSILYFNTLPNSYVLIIGIVILIIDLILIIMMHRNKRRKIGTFLSILFMIIMGIGSFYILKTAGLLNNLNLNYKTYNYSVIVLDDSYYEEIEDIAGEELGYYETDGDECEKSLNKLASVVDTENIAYSSYYEMASDLLEDEVEVIVIENSYLEILEENASNSDEDSTDEKNDDEETDSSDDELTNTSSSIEGFEDKIRVIYTFSIIVKTSDISKDINVTKEAFNIYVSGIDTYGEISSVSRSDVNMIITVNPSTKQILLTSIPRDYYVQLHGTSVYKDKLTHAGLYGVDMSIQTLEDLLDIEINYYIKVNFTSVIDIVDAIGGVNVYSDYTFTSIDGYTYTAGYNEVDGEEALSFARERKAFSSGDRQRIKNQQALLDAMFEKVTSKSIITKYNSLLNSISGSFVTNMPNERITALLKMQLSKNYSWTVTSNSLDGSDSYNYTYSYSSQKLYVMEPIEESVEYATELINKVLDGETLDPTYDGNASDVHQVTQSGTTSSDSTSSNSSNNNNSSSSSSTTTKELKVSLYKTSIEFNEGESNGYTYYNPTVTYGGVDVLADSTITYNVNGAVFYNQSDLISYVSNLSSGTYTVVYNITYNSITKSISQTVTINSVVTNEENEEDESEYNYDVEDNINE